MTTIDTITTALGAEAKSLLEHTCSGIPKETLHLPGPDVVDRIWAASDRPVPVLRSLQQLVDHGRLAGTGYLSILPVDQGIEHSAGASFAKNPVCFDPEGIVKLAVEGGCNAVASTLGVLGSLARRFAHKIPFLLKINHNEFLTYPNKFDQIMFAQVTNYSNRSFYDANRTFEVTFGDTTYTYKVFSVYSVDVNDADYMAVDENFPSDASFAKYMNETIAGQSIFPVDTTIGEDDHVITLSTCTHTNYANGRFVVHAVRVG